MRRTPELYQKINWVVVSSESKNTVLKIYLTDD